MRLRSIGSLQVSEVGLGCNNFGSRIDESKTQEVVSEALECGINFFDTADIYGKTLSEEYLGRALGSRRKDVLIATKFGYALEPLPGGASAKYCKQCCEDSLRRLGTDVIDLFQLHTPDPNTPIEETLGALDDLVKEGKVREIGCSNFTAEMLRNAESAVAPGGARFVSVQNYLNLLDQGDVETVIPECEKLGLAYLPFFPLASGLLTGKYRKGQPMPQGTRIKEDSEKLSDKNLAKVDELAAFAESRNHTLLELAFAWLLGHKVVSSVIAGATSKEQVRANAEAGEWVLDAVEMQQMNSA